MSEEAPFLELCRPAAFTLLEKRSRFLAELLPASSSEEAREGVAAQRRKYPDASQVVHAMVVGEKGEVMGCSDDGEPAGTAGRPVLEILKGSRVTQVLLTVTRWFGGIKLGTGGLVHACRRPPPAPASPAPGAASFWPTPSWRREGAFSGNRNSPSSPRNTAGRESSSRERSPPGTSPSWKPSSGTSHGEGSACPSSAPVRSVQGRPTPPPSES